MTKTTEMKVAALRAILPTEGVSYETLKLLTEHNATVPSISTLRKYGLLAIVREETYEEFITAEAAAKFDPNQLAAWGWFPEDGGYTYIHGRKFYGLA